MSFFIEFIKLGLVGLIAGLFSYLLANRSHRHQKWWELRVNAYQNVIAAVTDLVIYYNYHYSCAVRNSDMSKEAEIELAAYWKESHSKIIKIKNTGAFLLSADAASALADFIDSDNCESGDYLTAISTDLKQAKTCLEKLVSLSKKDLQVYNFRF